MSKNSSAMSGFVRDIRLALRILPRSPAFTVVCVLTLTLGIGSAMIMFSLVDGVLLDQAPIRDAKRIAILWSTNAQTGEDRSPASQPDFLDWRTQSTAFEQLAAFSEGEKWLEGFGEPRRLSSQMVSAGYFRVLRVVPVLGRDIQSADERIGAPRAVIISYAVWHTYFDGKADVVGKQIQLDGIPFTVIGVLPQDFWYPRRGAQIWTALTIDSSVSRASRSFKVVGRLRSGVTIEQVQQQMTALAHSLEVRFPASDQGWGIRMETLDTEQKRKAALVLAFGMGPVVLVLLIACINLTNLLMARGFSRQVEFATRAAMGASRVRLVQQQLTESFLLALAGGFAGTLMTYIGVWFLRSAFQRANSPFAAGIRVNQHVLLFGGAITIVLPLLFAVVPTLQVMHGSTAELLKQSATTARTRITLRRLPLTVLEITMAMVLLVITVLFSRALINLQRAAAPDIDSAHLVTFTLRHSGQEQHFDRLLAKLILAPGVSSVGLTDQLPLLPSRKDMQSLWMDHNGAAIQVPSLVLQGDKEFLTALRIRQLQGEPISAGTELQGVVVSESFARSYGGNVLGSKIRQNGEPWLTVTAVVGDWLRDVRSGFPLPTAYFPMGKAKGSVQIVIQTDRGSSVIPALKRVVRSWDPEQPVDDCETVAQRIENDLAESRRVIYAIGAFAFLAVLLGCIGVYGVMNYSISRRTRELGIRMALGATRVRVFGLILREGLLLLVVGLVVGWILGVAGATVVAHELIGVTPSDPSTALLCSMAILVTGICASCVPAWRAARVDPMIAVRSE